MDYWKPEPEPKFVDSMKFSPEDGNTFAFSERELFNIMDRAGRLARLEVENEEHAAHRDRIARMWLRLSDAANEAHAFAIRYTHGRRLDDEGECGPIQPEGEEGE